jgi:hypothetical protein
MEDTPIILLAAQSAFGLYGALYVGTAICAPRWFLDTLAINHIQRRRAVGRKVELEPWWTQPWAIFTMLAVGVLIYAAVYAVVAVIPYDWGGHDEDGEWQSLRYTIQVGIGFLGAIGLVGKLENNAEVLVWGPRERKAREAATKAIRYAIGVTPEMRDKIAAAAEKELEPDDLYFQGYEMTYAKDVQRWVGSSIRH